MPKRGWHRGGRLPIYVASHNAKGMTMSSTLTRGITEFLDIVGSAFAVSAAVRERRQADDADIRRLGLNPEQFRAIGRF